MLITLDPSDFLLAYPFEGEATFNRTFEGHPSISGLTYYSDSYPSHIKGVEVTALGLPMFISGMEVALLVGGGYRVELELQGGLAPRDSTITSRVHPLDDPVFISSHVDNNGFLDIGDIITGFPTGEILLKIGETDPSESRVPRQLLENAVTGRSYPRKFLYYGNCTIPETRNWDDTTIHTIEPHKPNGEQEILIFSEPGQGAVVDGIQLTHELVNAVWESDVDAVKNYDLTRTYIVNSTANVVTSSEYNVEEFEKGSGFFDTGGLTKERLTITETNGKKISVRNEKFGFIGSSIDTHLVSDASKDQFFFDPTRVSPLWDRFEDTTTTYTYNADGYLIQIQRVGNSVYRWKQEDDLQAIRLYCSYLRGEIDLEIVDLYRTFYTHPIAAGDDITTFTLTPFANFYRDYELGDETKFCSKEVRVIDTLRSRIDPEAEPPPPGEDELRIVAGERYEKIVETQIKIPLSRVSPKQSVEEFSTFTSEYKQQNENLSDRLKIISEENSEGRPSEAERLVLYGDDSPPDDLEDGVVLFNSNATGKDSSDPQGETISFEGVYTKAKALDCAKFLLDVENTLNCRTVTVNTPPSLSYLEGDRVSCLSDLWRIISLNTPLTFREDGVHLVGLSELELGREMSVAVSD